jgi:(p)ppGpp synthase/HD superfamily hydrolase
MMMLNFYEKAKAVAKLAHESIGQKRKYSGKPYYHHPLAVAELVSKHTDDERILAAACLHDVLEDVKPLNPEFDESFIEREFDSEVLSLVLELTNEYEKSKYPSLNRKERKRLEHERLSKVSDGAKLIKRADLYHNSTEMPSDDGFTKLWLKEKNDLEEKIGSYA